MLKVITLAIMILLGAQTATTVGFDCNTNPNACVPGSGDAGGTSGGTGRPFPARVQH